MGSGPDDLARNLSLSAEYPLFTGKGSLAVVGGGHSVLDRIEEIRAFPGDIWAINGAWKWCRDNGIEAYFYSIDPSPLVTPMVGGTAVLAGHCDPGAFKAADKAYRILEPFPGPTSAVAATAAAINAGYESVTFYGCEGCYQGATSHVYGDLRIPDLVRVQCGESYLTKLEMILQTEQLAGVLKRFPEIYSERSGGFLTALLEHGDYDVTHGPRRMLEGMNMQRFKFQGGRLMKAGDGRNGDGWFPTEEEAREWARPKPRSEMMAQQATTPEKVLYLDGTGDYVQRSGVRPTTIDWSRKWMAVKSDLKALGFEGRTKEEALVWAKAHQIEVPK
jgi:hypothetical protein